MAHTATWQDVNTRTPDLESDITGYGTHNRILVFYDDTTREVTAREDVREHTYRRTL